MDATTVLAHVGPIHEAAFVAVPLLLLGGILYFGRRRDMTQDPGLNQTATDSEDSSDKAAQ